MQLADSNIFHWLAPFAYQPTLIYLMVIGMMLASAVGLPLPEEVTLLSLGLLTYIGRHPELYPPPVIHGNPINPYVAAIIAFVAVVFSDFLIYSIGKYGGSKIKKSSWYKKHANRGAIEKIERWVAKYGIWSVAIFRFTPGIRFPGHMACGMLGLSPWKFVAVDFPVALISVPSQVLLVAFLGEHVIPLIQRFKVVLFSILGVALVSYLIYRLVVFIRSRHSKNLSTNY